MDSFFFFFFNGIYYVQTTTEHCYSELDNILTKHVQVYRVTIHKTITAGKRTYIPCISSDKTVSRRVTFGKNRRLMRTKVVVEVV